MSGHTAHALPERFNAVSFFVDRHVAEGREGRTAFRAKGRAAVVLKDAGAASEALGEELRRFVEERTPGCLRAGA